MSTGCFLMLDMGREQQKPPATATPLLKLSSQVFGLTDNLRALREGKGGGRGTCYWRLMCPMRMEYSAGGRSLLNKSDQSLTETG